MNRYNSLIQKLNRRKYGRNQRDTDSKSRRKHDRQGKSCKYNINSTSHSSPSASDLSSSGHNENIMDSEDFSYVFDVFEEHLNSSNPIEDINLDKQPLYTLKPTDDCISTLTAAPECKDDANKNQSISKDFDLESNDRSIPGYCVTHCGKILTQMKAHPYIYYDSSHPGMEELMKMLMG